ncbi:lipid A deacylase LpxR family protein [Oceanicola sp. D3]|uniref:lipid A-modifier LpxR family protein n=1 Tax=Oceanicola sp. D3 TaxID=2587163 RepID=UPI00111E857A|nr:lipid A-modifier LpxR family protein [Oceanicola sp. D3]QDC08736.1 lipid A deacylase LpxR family protein [Oceanicola sp. D3]
MKPLARLLALLTALTGLAMPAHAEERALLGWGRLFTNDVLGDGYDRWRTGAYTISIAYGPDWQGVAPDRFGQLLEFRLRSELIAPESLTAPAVNDRRFVGAFTLGVHSYSKLGASDLRAGLDLTFTGPQTGLGELQNTIHETFGLESSKVLDDQIPNNAYASLSAELSRELAFGNARLRPFLEVQAGVESFARVGADLTFGSYGRGALMARDITTGHLYQVIRSREDQGLSFLIGGDMAKVYSSEYLPEEDGFELTDTRTRLRAGMNWQGDNHGLFYGLTYLSEEFEAQTEGQMVGALQLRLFF